MSAFIKHIDYKSPILNLSDTQEIDCVVLFDNFSTYMVLKKENQLLALQAFDHKSNIITSFTEDDFKPFDLLYYNYKSITFFCSAPKDTLIPTSVFDKYNAEQYIKFNFQSIDNEVVLYDDLRESGITQVYTLNETFLNTLKKIVPQAIIKNKKTALLENFYKHNGPLCNLYVNTRRDCFDCMAFNENGLLFSNTFYYTSAQDYIYYLMNVIKQLNLNPEKLDLFLTGEIEKEGAIYNFIYKYIRNINFMQKPVATEWPLQDIPYHYFFNVLF